MQKYISFFTLGLKNALEYRGALLTWILVEFMTLTSAIFLWTAIYRDYDLVGNYSSNQMIMYYFLIPLVGAITSVHVSDQLPRKIKDGDLSKDLVKPYSYLLGFSINQFAIKIIQNTIKFPAYLIIGIILSASINLKFVPLSLLYGLFAALAGYILHVVLDTTLSLVSFWIEDTWSLSLFKQIALMIFGGLAFPIDLVPANWRIIYSILPFDLIYYFPVTVALGKSTPSSNSFYALKLIIWLIVLFILMRYLWKKGMRKYSAYGQ